MAEWHWQNVGSNLPLLFKLYKIWSVDSQENHLNCCHQMSNFKTKMHQIRFRLGLRPRPRCGSLQTGFRGPTSKGRGRRGKGRERGKGGEGRGRRRGGEEREREGKGREGKGLKPPQSKFSGYVAGNISLFAFFSVLVLQVNDCRSLTCQFFYSYFVVFLLIYLCTRTIATVTQCIYLRP